MAGKNEAKIRFTAETSEFNSGIRNANAEMAELRSELKLNQAQMQTNGSSVDYLSKQHEILQRQLEVSKQKTQLINEKLQVAIGIYGENSDLTRRLRIELNNAKVAEEKLSQAISACDDAIDGQNKTVDDAENAMETAAEAADDLADAMREAGEEAEESGEGYTIVKDIVADIASQAIQECIDAFQELATEGESALDKLQASTGVTSETMEQYKNVMYDVYNGAYGDSLDDVAESISVIVHTMGELDGSEMETVTKKALTLRDIYDMDVKESVRAANQMMKQFGITSDEAYNLIAQGSQKGLNANDDFLDIINEYSVHYSQLGLTAEEMLNTLTGAAEEGVFSFDKVGDAIKEFGIRVKDGSDTTNTAFTMLGLDAEQMQADFSKGGEAAYNAYWDVWKALNQIDDEVSRNTIGVNLFGTMWEDLGDKAIVSAMGMNDEFDGTIDTMEAMDEIAYGNLKSQIESIGRTLKNDLTSPVVDKLTPGVKEILNWTMSHLTIVEPVLVGIVAALGGFAVIATINKSVSMATKIWQALNVVMSANPIGIVVVLLASLVAAFVTAYQKSETFRNIVNGVFTQIKAVASTVLNEIVDFFSIAWQSIQIIWQVVQPYFTMIWENIKVVFSVVAEVLGGFFSNAWVAIQAVWNIVVSFFAMIWENIKLIFSVVASVLSGDFSAAWSGIVAIFGNAAGFFEDLWTNIKVIFSAVGDFFGNCFSAAWSGIVSIFGNVATFFKGIWDDIVGIFTNVGDAIGGAINNTVSKAINSVLSAAVEMINGFIGAINLAIDAINAIPGVSISKLDKLSVPALANGGIATKPVMALVGEGKEDEAIAPISKLQGYVTGAVKEAAVQADNREMLQEIRELREDVKNSGNIYLDGDKISKKTGKYDDKNSGKRMQLSERGVLAW